MRHIPLSLLLLAAFALAGCQPRGTAGPGNDTVPAAPSAGADYQALYDSLGKDLADNLARWPNHQDKYVRQVRGWRGFHLFKTYSSYRHFASKNLLIQVWQSGLGKMRVRVHFAELDSLQNANFTGLIDTVLYSRPLNESPVVVFDINNDGHLDLMLSYDKNPLHAFFQNPHHLWLWNPARKKFEYSPTFSDLFSPRFNPETGIICDEFGSERWNGGYHNLSTYRFIGDSLIHLKDIFKDRTNTMQEDSIICINASLLMVAFNRSTNRMDTVINRVADDCNLNFDFNNHCPECRTTYTPQQLDIKLAGERYRD